MFKIIILLLCMTLALPGSSQSASFDCNFGSFSWASLGTVYYCEVQNSVIITSPDAAQIDSVTGNHWTGYNNDNVEALFIHRKGEIHYFPRGLDKIFKNLKGIQIYSTGIKEIHQSDLKDFPNLKVLSLSSNSLEIVEKDLFDSNPNLDYIALNSNQISHIDPNVFDKLTNLKTLDLESNVCIRMIASHNPSALQYVIKTAEDKCTNSDYSNLVQKVKDFEAESSALSSEQFKEKLEKLENEVKNSKFSNTFHSKLQELKAGLVEKAQEEAKTSTTTTEPTTTTTEPTTTTTEPTTASTSPTTTIESSKFDTCAAQESKVDKMTENLTDLMALATNGTDTQQCAALKDDLRNCIEDMDTKLKILDKNVQNTKTAMLRKIQNMEVKLTKIMKALNINE
ncbi:SLIT and NTRK-like protein 6 isoform X3 [Chironomus tepperi]